MQLNETQISILQFMYEFPNIHITYWEQGNDRPQYSAWWSGMPKIKKQTFKMLRKNKLIQPTHFYRNNNPDVTDRKLIFNLTLKGKQAARWNEQVFNLRNVESEKARKHMDHTMGVLMGVIE